MLLQSRNMIMSQCLQALLDYNLIIVGTGDTSTRQMRANVLTGPSNDIAIVPSRSLLRLTAIHSHGSALGGRHNRLLIMLLLNALATRPVVEALGSLG